MQVFSQSFPLLAKSVAAKDSQKLDACQMFKPVALKTASISTTEYYFLHFTMLIDILIHKNKETSFKRAGFEPTTTTVQEY